MAPRIPLVLASLAIGVVSLVLLVVVESRVDNAMLPLTLFNDRDVHAHERVDAVSLRRARVMMFLVPLNLIQVRGFSATVAGAALLPFPVIMFALSRWSGGLVSRVGRRLPLTIGPRSRRRASRSSRDPASAAHSGRVLSGVVVLGLGMAVTVAPLTTTVMDSAPRGIRASRGVNNAVSRVAGLLAIAAFGVALAQTFELRVAPRLDGVGLSPPERRDLDRELSRMAGADVTRLSIPPQEQRAIRAIVDESFVSAFRLVMLWTSGLALAAAFCGSAIRQPER